MLSKKLSELRKSRGLTHSDLAKRLNVTRQAYSMYESGKREMSYEALNSIADFYGVTLDYLLGRTNTVPMDMLTSDELEIINSFRATDERGKAIVKAVVKAAAKQ